LAISRDVTTEVIALNKIATTQIELFDENEAQAEKIKAQKRQLNSIDYSVKNSLSIVANSLTRQALDESDPQTASKLKQAALRIYPIRKVHDVECHIDHNTVNLKDYLTPLLTEAHALLEEDMLTLLMEIAPVETSTDNAMNKADQYKEVLEQIEAVIDGEPSVTARYATASCLLSQAFDYFFWTGFYVVDPDKENELVVGPYQGTLGCLRIAFDRGVCGACATQKETIIVFGLI